MGNLTRVLLATSNGTGLGHLARAMAIARRLPDGIEPVIFTLSSAAPVVRKMGFSVEYMPSYRQPASGSDWQWNLRLRHRLEQLVAELSPDALVFDGVHPYRALTHVLTAARLPSMWVRRPMWRPGRGRAALSRTAAFTEVLEPGELAEEDDRGATVARRAEAISVGPITYLDRGEILPRERAAEELGIDSGDANALVALGQGAGLSDAVGRILNRLTAAPDIRPVVLESSLAPGLALPDGVRRLRPQFPLARHYRAFDFAISAAGYNAFHELLAARVPTLFVPMVREADDQRARAEWARGANVAAAVDGPDAGDLEQRLEELLDADVRIELSRSAEALEFENGARRAADAVGQLASERRRPRPVGRLRRWIRFSSYPVGPSLPLAGALLVRQLRARPELGTPARVILALGVTDVPGDELEARLSAAIDESPARPERTLVITDSLALGKIRALGCGVEYVPSAGDAVAGSDYDSFLRARLREVLRGRGRQITALDPEHERLARELSRRPR